MHWDIFIYNGAVECIFYDPVLYLETAGIWLHESGVLGASPDGLITAVGTPSQDLFYQTPEARTLLPQVLEVKCPVRAEHTTVQHLVDNEATFYLSKYMN